MEPAHLPGCPIGKRSRPYQMGQFGPSVTVMQVIHRQRAVEVRSVDPPDGKEYNVLKRNQVLQHRLDTRARYGDESLKDLE